MKKLHFHISINKKFVFILLIVTAISATKNYAQDSYGIKGGFNLAKEKSKTTSEINSILGYNLGFFYSKAINDNFEVQPELVLSTEGGKIPQYINIGYDYNYDRYTFLNLPVLARYSFRNDLAYIKNLKLYAGPQFGFTLRSKFEVNGQTITNPDYMAKMNVSLALGAGYQIIEKIEATIRYNIGLTNLVNDPSTASTGVKVSTRTLQFGVAYRLN